MHMINMIPRLLIFVFLTLNFLAYSHVLDNHGVTLKIALLVLIMGGVLVYLHNGFLRAYFFLVGLTLPLYGFQSYTFNNHIFECIIVYLSLLLLFMQDNVQQVRQKGSVLGICVCSYLLLALFSLLLLPVSSFLATLKLWGFFGFSNALLAATPDIPLYSVAAVNRLAIFVLFIFLINGIFKSAKLYTALFFGCGCSVVWSCIIGVLHHYGFYSLDWLRPDFIAYTGVHRLHSVFGNPGWFAEYTLLCTPFVLLLVKRVSWIFMRVSLLVPVFILIALCLFLTGSRTSWLIIPIALVLCFVGALLFSNQGEQIGAFVNRPKGVLRSTSIAIMLAFPVLAIPVVTQVNTGFKAEDQQQSAVAQSQYMHERIKDILNPYERAKLWRESLVLVKESPLWGLGYEGYRWHKEVMNSIPSSLFLKNRQTRNNWDTAHNFYIQLVAGNGIVGLCIWLVLIGYAVYILFRGAAREDGLLAFALLCSLLIFHLYGLTQSMQYIASIYFLVFMIIGYTLHLDSSSVAADCKGHEKGIAALVCAVVAGGCVWYGMRFQSKNLAERYDIPRYATERGRIVYAGFYKREDWGDAGYYRWSGRKAEIYLSRSGRIKMSFACYAPRLTTLPLTIVVKLGDDELDRYTFKEPMKLSRIYQIPEQGRHSQPMLSVNVSRTWNPKKERLNNDMRELGVAVSEPLSMPKPVVQLPLLLK